jgi:tyrosine-protein kinase Etk/Wzc
MPDQIDLKNGLIGSDDEETLNLKDIIGKVVHNWKLFVICFVVFMVIAWLFIRFVKRNYEIDAAILIEMQSGAGAGGGAASMMGGGAGGALSSLTDVSSLLGIPNNANNEVQILESTSLMTNVVKKLQLNVATYRRDVISAVELFQDAPFTIDIQYKSDSVDYAKYKVEINGDNIHIMNSKLDVDKVVKFGQPITLPQYTLVLRRTYMPVSSYGYYITVQSVERTVELLSKDYTVEMPDKQATVIDLTFKYKNPAKGEAIVNELMKEYMKADLADKDQIADSTLTFIDTRLALVENELSGIENNLEKFKEQNKIADIDAQSQALIDATADYQKQQSAIEIQLSVIQELQTILNDPNNRKVLPGVLAIPDAGFATAVEEYNELLLARDRQTISSTEDNPFVQNIDLQLSNFRATLLKTIATYKASLLTTKKDLVAKNSSYTNLISAVPAKERVFLDYSRKQDLKQALYLFLLQQRETTAISEKSTISSARIIDPAKSQYVPAGGAALIALVVCLAAAFFIPFGIVSLKDSLRVKILSKTDIESHTTIPVVGEISHSSEFDNTVVVKENSRSAISEQFRAVRTNLQFLLNASKTNVIMVTSSMSGEGKSFITLNLGSAIALSGKKVVFLDLDLRKPKLTKYLEINPVGFTNYAVSETLDLEDIIQAVFGCVIRAYSPKSGGVAFKRPARKYDRKIENSL